MSYMRGPCYVWRDDHVVQVWAGDGYDGWDDTGWAENQKHPQTPESRPHGNLWSKTAGDWQAKRSAFHIELQRVIRFELTFGFVVETLRNQQLGVGVPKGT